jgi:hypothetical protein
MMKFDTLTAAEYASQNLDKLFERASRDTAAALEQKSLPAIVTHFDQLRETVKALAVKVSALQKHVDAVSQELIPTMFLNANNVKTITVVGVGRATVNYRWSASILVPDKAFTFLRNSGNGGLIEEGVHPQTLGAHAKDEAEAERPLPSDLFKVTPTPYTSITTV